LQKCKNNNKKTTKEKIENKTTTIIKTQKSGKYAKKFTFGA
jgi:hypothetical protein